MDANPKYTLVGIFLALILCALVLWIIWLWNIGSKDQSALYLINIRKQSLAGLQVDGVVSMRGLKVGSIKTIDIDSNDVESAWIKVALNTHIPIKRDTKAVIARNPLTGLAAIDLLGSTSASELLTAENGQPPVIAEGAGGIDQAFQLAPALISKATTAIEKIELLLSDENIVSAGKVLKHAEHAAEKLTPLIDSIHTTVLEYQGLPDDMKGKIEPVLLQLNSTLLEFKSAIQIIAKDFDQLSKAGVSATQSLKEPRSSILGLPSGELGPGETK